MFKCIFILIPTLFLSSSLQAESSKENSTSHQDISTLQESTSRSGLTALQDIHYFQLTFDDYALGGIPYEPFE